MPAAHFLRGVAWRLSDTKTGKQVWKSYAIPDPPKAARVNSAGTCFIGLRGGHLVGAYR